ncbi:MmcQ/YjbR family DNA-binding protein [Williamsia herbipolensis]|uniref:MmcQ/YjbR family DNA-binding protein n=1 Tax=Williamsia herbipolensis TaxID=1603258 RepID=A0AAU4K1M9_9NOCA|nr:hypothetical protein [Williamsia herbipolensis]
MTLSWESLCARAVELPEVTVGDHHGMGAIRFRKNVLATAPDDTVVRIMVAEDQIDEAVAEFDWCTTVMWGAKPSAVAVTLAEADPAVVFDLLTDAWRRRAPKTTVAWFDGL